MVTHNLTARIILGLLMAPPKDNTGAMAREMAAAPLNPKANTPEPQGQAEPKGPTLNPANRFASIFGQVIFKAAPSTSKVYGDEDGSDRLTRKLASVEVEFGTSRFFAKGKVQAVQPRNGAGEAYPEFLFQASQFGGQALHSDDPTCQAELGEWKEYLLDLFDAWQATGANTSAPTAAKKKRVLGISLKA